MEDLNENINNENIDDIFYVKKNKWYKNNCIKCGCILLCISLFTGIIYINIKCGSFSNDISPCDYPKYCPNKMKNCDGSFID